MDELVERIAKVVADFNGCGHCGGECAACSGEARAVVEALGLREERGWRGTSTDPDNPDSIHRIRRYASTWEQVTE